MNRSARQNDLPRLRKLSRGCCLIAALTCVLAAPLAYLSAEENDYYRLVSIFTPQAPSESRSEHWKPAPQGLALEVSGLAVLDDRRLAVAIRKGEIWILTGVYGEPPENVTYTRFASGLHEPLSLL